MLKPTSFRLLPVALAALVASAAGCKSDPLPSGATGDTGSIAIALQLPGGSVIDRVDYEITGNGMPPRRGSVDTAQSGATITLLVDGIPAGVGYRIVLTAPSRGGTSRCTGEAPFNVSPSSVTNVVVASQCRAVAPPGSVVVTGSFNDCPAITSLTASPLEVAVGATITLTSSVVDPNPGGLTLSWSTSPSNGGAFASPQAANTTFVCRTAGQHMLVLNVSDGACAESRSISVFCKSPTGGNDSCDRCVAANCAEDGPGCSALTGTKAALCQTLFSCVRRTNCSAVSNSVCWCGTSSPPVCSTVPGAANGLCRAEEVAAAESTDLATIASRYNNPNFASGNVHNRIACERDLCANVCPPPPDVPPPPVEGCDACVAANCAEDGPGCSSLTGTKAALCQNLYSCVRRTNCGAISNTVCWCGTASPPVCSTTAGAANGPCLAEEVAAAESTDLATISARYTNPTFASGAVHNRISCERDLCAGICPP